MGDASTHPLKQILSLHCSFVFEVLRARTERQTKRTCKVEVEANVGNDGALKVVHSAGDQQWTITWHPGSAPPAHVNHGALGVCFSTKGVVFISQDGQTWDFPGGRPENNETPRDTLIREVFEESCCTVRQAKYLGYAVARCNQGPELGKELTRTHWCAEVDVADWVPAHETTARRFLPPHKVMDVLHAESGLREVYEAIFAAALKNRPHQENVDG